LGLASICRLYFLILVPLLVQQALLLVCPSPQLLNLQLQLQLLILSTLKFFLPLQ